MHSELIRSQAQTMREWATDWEREANAVSGAGEVGFLLRRAAKQAEGCIGAGPPGHPVEFVDVAEVASVSVEGDHIPHTEPEGELRHG